MSCKVFRERTFAIYYRLSICLSVVCL